MNVDDFKLFAKNKNEQETVIQAGRIYSKYRGMEFDREIFPILIMESGKRQMADGIEQPNQEKIRTFGEKETYKYLEILEADIIKHAGMKEKRKKKQIPLENEETTWKQNT